MTAQHSRQEANSKQNPQVLIQQNVEYLCKCGFALHWLHPKSKRPIGNDWAAKPVLSAAQLRASYRDGNNLGVRLGKWSVVSGYYLHIIDMDIRVDELADEAIDKLGELLPELDLDSCPTVQSGSMNASRHFFLLSEKPFPPKKFAHSEGFALVMDESLGREVKKWDWELHLLGTGAQAAIPPSIHPTTGKPYRWLREFDFDLLDMGLYQAIPSAAIEEMIGYEEPSDVDPQRQQPMGLSDDEILQYLDALDPVEWFEDRDQWLRVGMALHHETDGSEWAFEVWCAHSKVSEKFDAKDSKRVWKSFKNRAAAPFRMASLVAVVREQRLMDEIDDLGDEVEAEVTAEVDPLDAMIDEIMAAPPKKPSKSQIALAKETVEVELGKEVPGWVKRLNKKHGVARISGKTVILDFQQDGSVAYGTANDLHTYYENDRRPKDGTMVPITKLWIQNKQRRQYPDGIVFAPEGGPAGAYNHWQGFSVKADPTASCRLFIKHLREVFCAGNEGHFWYMIGWLAHMIQRPWEKPGVAVVAKGRKGVGKDTVAQYVGKLFLPHYITIANKDQFIGKFNAHQEKVLLMHVQEGFWAGDKRDEGPLKYLITSSDVMIEPKGVNAFKIRSVLRLFISSNERWVVPATEDERRYFVVNVADTHQRDHAYFETLQEEMNGDGPAALLDYLQNYDLTGFQVRDVPDTEALAEQKVEGLKNIERWWHGVLQHGSIAGNGHGQAPAATPWNSVVRVNKDDFREGYSRWMRNRRYDGEEVSESEFTKRMKHMIPGMEIRRARADGSREHYFVLPDLDACRRAFEGVLGSELVWPEDEVETEDEREPMDMLA